MVLDFLCTESLIQHVGEPTRRRGEQTPSILDLIITKFANDVDRLQFLSPVGKSDHALLTFSLNLRGSLPPDRYMRRYGKLNKVALLREAKEINWRSYDLTDGIEDRWLAIKGSLVKLADKFAPVKKIKRMGNPPWWSARLTKAVARKAQAWKRYCITGGHCRYLEYQETIKLFNNLQWENRNSYERKLAQNAKVKPKAFHNYVQSKSALRGYVGSLKDKSGISADCSVQKANILLEFFEGVHVLDDGGSLPSVKVESSIEMEPVVILEDEVLLQLSKLNVNKTAGPDNIHPALLRPLADVLAVPLTKLFNQSLEMAIVPRDWNLAAVTPIHKGGSKETAGNFRPVSLTSVVLKIMERIVREKLAEFFTNTNQITARQHGFMKKRSCLSNLLCFLDEITIRLDKGEKVEVCYLDFQKAFDSVNHRMLLLKLESYGVSSQLVNWVKAFLENRTFHVVVEGESSRKGKACSGVPQGSVLGPLLFLVFINDLAGSLKCPCYMFADDVKIVGNPTSDALRADLETIYHWTKVWKLPLNQRKCQRLIAKTTDSPPLLLGSPSNRTEIPDVTVIRDLGVQIAANFTPTAQCEAAAKKAKKAFYLLKRTMASRDPEVLLPLYKVHVRPHLEYCIQAWSPCMKKDKKLLEQVQRAFTRVFPELKDLDYSQRLSRLGLFSLGRRRLRGDLIETYKGLMGLNNYGSQLFTYNGNTALRGHLLKLDKKRVSTTIRANFFSNRVVNAWNKLPQPVVTAVSVDAFKQKLDQCWFSLFPELE
jgi:hypothetical protein